ncbi:hypothetical protein BY996DRAFT_6440663 [Phakopsora pachyrhizi]|nr:hypothetical protein BY996DRAFT_6440663 [Phakopsora pachyrhizi]
MTHSDSEKLGDFDGLSHIANLGPITHTRSWVGSTSAYHHINHHHLISFMTSRSIRGEISN